ncbi:MAG TPA: HAMP domain-containing sensor histidine kinase, partial [Chloroflexota bacterium]
EAIQARDEFLATAAHDLKAPLTAIKGGAQLLRRQATTKTLDLERLVAGLLGLDMAATRLARQVDQLLDITRMRAGQPLDLQRGPTDLVALARQAASEHRQTSEAHDISVETDGAELVGNWDRGRIERVIDNLLGNAVKYSPDGGPVLVTLRRERDDRDDWAVIAVRDRGIGIPAGELDRIFERFGRGSNVPEPINGSGIGLTSVRQIVEQHGGAIAVASRVGEGSTFTVRLPLGDGSGQ